MTLVAWEEEEGEKETHPFAVAVGSASQRRQCLSWFGGSE